VSFHIVKIAWIFSGFASMPRVDTSHPKNCPADTLKEHFVGLSLSLYQLKLSKVFDKLLIKDFSSLVVMTTSSM
jgi:hypothetical protein